MLWLRVHYVPRVGGLLIIFSRTIVKAGNTQATGSSIDSLSDPNFKFSYSTGCAGGGSINVFCENILDNNIIVR